MAEIKKLLDDAIKEEIQSLDGLDPSSKEKSSVISDLAALHKLRIEEIKTEAESEDKRETRACARRENQLKEEQLQNQKIDRYVNLGIAAAELVLPLIFYGTWMKKGFKFEETGTFTSQTFKNLISRFRPTKKG